MVRHKRILNRWVKWGAAVCFAMASPSWANKACVAVLYPQVSEPYRVVLDEIIAGIEQGTDWLVQRFPLAESDNVEEEKALIVGRQCKAIIGLGRAGLEAATPFASRVPVVAGAVLMQPGQSTAIPTVSFVPDSADMFTRLKHFMPGVKTVTVVFNPMYTDRLVKAATKSADTLGITVRALAARDLSAAAALYENVLEESDPATDAIWLIRDPSVMDSSAVLNLVLERAWQRRLVVFSNQLTHVKHGVLFSVYPNNKQLGARLAKLAQTCGQKSCAGYGVMTLRELDTAVNIRTAQRLGIKINRRRDPYVNLVLPAN